MKKLLINTIGGGAGWTGGLYYARNIAYQLTQNPYIRENCRIYLCCTRKNRRIFEDLRDRVKILTCPREGTLPEYLYREWACVSRGIDYLYWSYDKPRFSGALPVAWIADFQHDHYPAYFSEAERAERTGRFQRVAKADMPLILSSRDARKDFCKYDGGNREKVYVVPFVSYIEPEIRRIAGREEEILKTLGLEGVHYACVMNQFWQHKNHQVVFRALKTLYEKYPEMNLDVVMTGEMSDYRNPDYISALKRYAEDPAVAKHLHLLGFLGRDEQIAVMKKAEFVIQPSLFEGWGTVVEDAKVLDKTILLSDIPVHREQKSAKCTLFDPQDPEKLADLMAAESKITHRDDPDEGIRDMVRRAEIYSEGFEKMLREAEKG